MKILLNQIGKRYQKEWIFRHVNYQFNSGESYAILGNNGSGKSTLLQIIIGATQHSEGQIGYSQNEQSYAPEKIFQEISFAAPYVELVEEMTLNELLLFHATFKPFYHSVTQDSIIQTLGLESAQNKQIGQYSSGMKQRVKLAIAFFGQSKLLCLDEPTSNLDDKGIELYHSLIQKEHHNRTIIIASNDEHEYSFCKNRISIVDYK